MANWIRPSDPPPKQRKLSRDDEAGYEFLTKLEHSGDPDWKNIREDITALRRWLSELAKQNNREQPNYKPLLRELRRELQGFSYHPELDETGHFDPISELIWPSMNRANLAFAVAQVFDDEAHKRIRFCRLCDVLFALPPIRGPVPTFCSRTHANTFKKRAMRERKQLQEQEQSEAAKQQQRAARARQKRKERKK